MLTNPHNIWLYMPYIMRSRATLALHDKVLLNSGVIVEVKIWDIADTARYPDR